MSSPPSQLGPWKVGKKVGQGTFSSVYEATFSKPSGKETEAELLLLEKHQWVLKLSPTFVTKNSKTVRGATLLNLEYDTYKYLRETSGNQISIPATPITVKHHYNSNCDGWCYLAIQRLHVSLDEALDVDIIDTGMQLIHSLKIMHDIGFVYRDLKPQNIMFDTFGKVFLVDMGGATKFVLSNGTRNKNPASPCGTPRYMSVNVHQGVFASGRDDLESLCYVCLKCICGGLPWDYAKSESEILEMKINSTPKKLTDEIVDIHDRKVIKFWLEYVRSLQHDDVIDYKMLTRTSSIKKKQSGSRNSTPLKRKKNESPPKEN